MEQKNTKRKRRAKRAGFLFFDLIGAFAISTILITMVIISASFLASRHAILKEYLYAKQLLYQTMFDVQQGDAHQSKTEEIGNISFAITQEKIMISSTTTPETLATMPAIMSTISWKSSKGTKEELVFVTFDHGAKL